MCLLYTGFVPRYGHLGQGLWWLVISGEWGWNSCQECGIEVCNTPFCIWRNGIYWTVCVLGYNPGTPTKQEHDGRCGAREELRAFATRFIDRQRERHWA